MRKTILITGGFGFLGGRLGQFLSKDYKIILGTRSDQNSPNWLPKAKVSKIDWDNDHSLNAACDSVDIIIHASGLNAQECRESPEKALLVNGVFTQNLVKAALNKSVKKIIYLSTVHVYSSRLSGVINEDSPILNTHPYATSNMAGEESVLEAASQGKLEGFICRTSNVFGRPVSRNVNCWMLLVNDLCKQAVEKRVLSLRNNASTVRDFVTMHDFCSSIKFLVENQGSGDIVNITSGKTFSIYDMATRIQNNCKNVLDFKPPLLIQNRSPILNNLLDLNSNFLRISGFKFQNDIDEEIKDLIRYCHNNFELC